MPLNPREINGVCCWLQSFDAYFYGMRDILSKRMNLVNTMSQHMNEFRI